MSEKNARGSVVRLPPRWFFNRKAHSKSHSISHFSLARQVGSTTECSGCVSHESGTEFGSEWLEPTVGQFEVARTHEHDRHGAPSLCLLCVCLCLRVSHNACSQLSVRTTTGFLTLDFFFSLAIARLPIVWNSHSLVSLKGQKT